jgi:hypothetical protein
MAMDIIGAFVTRAKLHEESYEDSKAVFPRRL